MFQERSFLSRILKGEQELDEKTKQRRICHTEGKWQRPQV